MNLIRGAGLLTTLGLVACAPEVTDIDAEQSALHGGGARGRYRFWIGDEGPTGPLFSGPQQYPFLCSTSEAGLGQPNVDNQDGLGNAVYAVEGVPTSGVVGYSADCSIDTRVDYFYLATDGRFRIYDAANPPEDLVQFPVGETLVPFVVRVETGTINRFVYNIAMLAPFPESLARPSTLNNSAWNQKAIYYLGGGVGIGHWQGEAFWHGGLSSAERGLFAAMLQGGYAIMTSSGNTTATHYNLELAEETALMVKRHFTATYGRPDYTISIGGSGGGIQQYIFGQNRPGLFDAGIPAYAYPDMVTQTIHILDCNLLEQYFLEETTLDPTSMWATWSNHRLIEGLNSSDTVINSLTGLPGSSECIEGWFFAEPTAHNPRTADPQYFAALQFYGYPASVIDDIRWTHWNDLENIYGTTGPDGFAPTPYDNVGVQYGLGALLDGDITADEFLRINRCVGGWKSQDQFTPWPFDLSDPFDSANMTRDPLACRFGVPAPRSVGDRRTIRRAFTSGHVFRGRLRMPVIDLRPYLDPVLDMHNARQSFSARQRMLDHDGNADNQVIWFTENEADFGAKAVLAIQVLDEYLTTGQRPALFEDACFDAAGAPIGFGPTAWSGILDGGPAGPCTTAYPLNGSSRTVAGDGMAGDVFKCALQTVDEAIAGGVYGSVAFSPAQLADLRNTFAEGVCDYDRQRGRRGWR